MVYCFDITEPSVAKFMSVLKRYNKAAYKQIIFKVVPEIRKGNFIGDAIDNNTYYIKLNFSDLFSKVYGEVGVIYKVTGKHISMWISNKDLFFELYRRVCPIKHGVPIIDNKADFRLKIHLACNCTK